MHQFQLAVATRCFEQPLLQSIASAAALKVPGIQFDLRYELRSAELTETGRRDLLHQLNEQGLKISGAVFPLQQGLYEPDKIDLRIAALRDAMKFAYSIKATTLCFRTGRIPNPDTKERKLLVEVLSDLAQFANHVGTSLAVTPTQDTAESLKALIDEIKTGPVGIDFDPAHFAMSGHSVVDSLKLLHNLVLHVQLRDGDRSIDGGQEVAVGEGSVDWIEVMALLGEMDYRGWLTAIRNQGTTRIRDVSRGVKMVQRILLGG